TAQNNDTPAQDMTETSTEASVEETEAPVEETESSVEETEAPVEETEMPVLNGAVSLTVVDENGDAVPNVNFDLSGRALTADENGQAHIDDLAPDAYTLTIDGLPEGYQGELNQELIVEENTVSQLTLTVTTEPAQASAIISIVDENGTQIPNVGVLMEGVEVVTDEQGQALIADLPAGEYQFDLSSIPNNYTGE